MYRRVPKGQLADQVTSQIEDQILSGDLVPGDRLPSIRDLSARLGVSQTTVREAVKVLESRGLLAVKPGSGVYVAKITMDSAADSLSLLLQYGSISVQDLCEVRRALEIGVAELVAERRLEEHFERMLDAMHRMEEHLGDPIEYIAADFDFHLALADGTGNPLFPLLTMSLLDVLQESRRMIFDVPGAPGRGQSHHRVIYECVRQRDGAGCRRAMAQHLDQIQADGAASESRTGAGE
ncbi:MAG: FadR family transcriptional regulator [Anaerolineae bacterium]|nr:FadR family transcriptional regulator [Anaerolineae bacterium]